MPVLPSILFFVAAYGVYALMLAWCRRQRFRFQEKAAPRPRWLILLRGAALLGLLLGLAFWLKPDLRDQKLKLAGILGLSEEVTLRSHQELPPVMTPPLKEGGEKGQPVYALLHPESPPTLLPPAKLPAATQVRKGRATTPVKAGKNPPGGPSLKSSEKSPAKPKDKKKPPPKSSGGSSGSFPELRG